VVLDAQVEAQTVMKLASATINDGQHEWQKLFAESASEHEANALCCQGIII